MSVASEFIQYSEIEVGVPMGSHGFFLVRDPMDKNLTFVCASSHWKLSCNSLSVDT